MGLVIRFTISNLEASLRVCEHMCLYSQKGHFIPTKSSSACGLLFFASSTFCYWLLPPGLYYDALVLEVIRFGLAGFIVFSFSMFVSVCRQCMCMGRSAVSSDSFNFVLSFSVGSFGLHENEMVNYGCVIVNCVSLCR